MKEEMDAYLRVLKKFDYVSEGDLGYLAGIIDGEGHVGLKSRGSKHDRSYFDPFIKICNTKIALFEYLRRIGICNIVKVDCRFPKRRQPLYYITLSANDLRIILPKVLKYLVIKKRQASILLRYLDISASVGRAMGVWKQTRENRLEMIKLKKEITRLNKTGVMKDER